jgi:putative heme-binding domain-containing protein
LRSASDDSSCLQLIVQSLALKKESAFDQQVASATGGQSERVMREMLEQAKRTVSSKAPGKKRVDAVQLLRLGTFAESQELFVSLLQPTEPAELQSVALTTLATFSNPEVAQLLIQAWPTLSPRLRSSAADVLGSRDIWLESMLRAVAAGEIPTSELDPARLQLYAASTQESVRALVKEIAARNRLASRADVLAAYKDVLQLPGDATRGKAVFGKICATCHQFGGTGFAIGPNLAAMRNRGPDAILTNVLAPNQEVNPQFVNYVVVTTDGRQLTGIIAAETATSVTLQRAENQSDTVLRIDIEELRGTGVSLMPEGLEKQIDQQTMADLLEYLKTAD